ncbi:hypothetical protein B0H14DRAFT_2424214, partial [Mycena olivaceomarginata]
MTVAGMSQYLASVQGMPEQVEEQLQKITRAFLWGEDKRAPLNMDILYQPIEAGGKNLLCLEDRNRAINLKILQRYLTFGPTRAKWTNFTDRIFAKHLPLSPIVTPESRINPLLQTWSPLISSLREPCKSLYKTVKDFNVRIDVLGVSPELKRFLPIWFHVAANSEISKLNNTVASKCLRSTHQVTTV